MPQLFTLDFDCHFTPSPRENLEMEARRERETRMIAKYVSEIDKQSTCLTGRKPWEMTSSVWKSIIDPVSKAYRRSICIGMEVAEAFHKRYGYDHNGYAFHFTSISNSRHEVQVAHAYLRGDYVPDEVASEYPKGYWKTTYDLWEYGHLPRYVASPEERCEAIACWDKNKAHVEKMIKERSFNYLSELELNHRKECYDRILSELSLVNTI